MRIYSFINADWMQDKADSQQREHLVILLVDLWKRQINQTNNNLFIDRHQQCSLFFAVQLHQCFEITVTDQLLMFLMISKTKTD